MTERVEDDGPAGGAVSEAPPSAGGPRRLATRAGEPPMARPGEPPMARPGEPPPTAKAAEAAGLEDRHRMAHPIQPERARTAAAGGPRPLLERLGMAAVAAVLGLLFAGVALAAYLGGELFLAVMAAIGSLMTLWVGALTLVRG